VTGGVDGAKGLRRGFRGGGRIVRRLFGIVTIASSVLWVAVVASWVAGHDCMDEWAAVYVRAVPSFSVIESAVSITSCQGELRLEWSRTETGVLPGTRRPPFATPGGGLPPGHFHWVHNLHLQGIAPVWWSNTFWIEPPAPHAGLAYRDRRAAIRFPYWVAAIATATIPLAWTASRLRPHRPPGRCRRCGYDLRASPQRCPECGAVAISKQPTGSAADAVRG
jgi:hypothetical protein